MAKKPLRRVVITRDPVDASWIAQSNGTRGVGSTRELALAALKVNVAIEQERSEMRDFREEIEVDW